MLVLDNLALILKHNVVKRVDGEPDRNKYEQSRTEQQMFPGEA